MRKLDRSQWDRIAEESACVVAMGIEVQALLPIDDSALRAAWHDLYVDGDAGVAVEVQSCILSRTVNIRDIPSLHRLINEHASKCPVPASSTVASMNQLEQDSFALVIKQINYDLQALRVAKAKRATWEGSIFHVKLTHKLEQHQKSKDAAKWFMDNFVCVIHSEQSDELMRKFQLHRAETINRLRLDSTSCAAGFCFSSFFVVVFPRLCFQDMVCSHDQRPTSLLSTGSPHRPSRTLCKHLKPASLQRPFWVTRRTLEQPFYPSSATRRGSFGWWKAQPFAHLLWVVWTWTIAGPCASTRRPRQKCFFRER